MKRVLLALGTVVLVAVWANATIINIPDDYPTIQEGIDHGNDGDTVLVQPDTYYENINFNGHNVVLASLFLTTGDTSYISRTIIDGDSAGSVITFTHGEDSTTQVVGFTIQNGNADEGGGIYCLGSNPTITNNIIRQNSSEWEHGYGGGVYCQGCRPTITNNTISDNWAGRFGHGGAISCYFSNPTISNNTIKGNWANFGSGIYCWQSEPTISNNSISENYGVGIACFESSPTITDNSIRGNPAYGISCYSSTPIIGYNTISGNAGGIYCRESSPEISNNTIQDNSASITGGGIWCYMNSNPMISNNTISGNRGGGIACWSSSPKVSSNIISHNRGSGILCRDYSSPTISKNLITGNQSYQGGGIRCGWSSNPTLTGNTISRNLADYGGGVFCRQSDPTITNTILWENTAPNGPELYVDGAGPTVSYCNVQGGWPGTGNIDADPIFVGCEREDFYLRWHSPCIDAGDPDPSYNDPDGTRNDMGAFYFNQDVDGIVEVYPLGEPIVIPPEGGDIIYDGWVFNFFGHPGRVDIWTYAFVPEVGQYGPINLRENIYVPADSFGIDDITQHVPGDAPEGDYVFAAYVGNYPNTIIDSSYFYFSKSGSIAGGIPGWFEGGEWLKGKDLVESSLPSDYALSQNYPNPFNATAIIDFQLPVDGYVKLEVYNTLGQRVATLVDGRQGAGYKSVSWDASSVSSGLYFYRFSAGDYTETRRMMLVK